MLVPAPALDLPADMEGVEMTWFILGVVAGYLLAAWERSNLHAY